MKKTTRFLAVLAAMATLMVSAVPAYAADESSTPTVAEETSKITQDVYSQINAGDKTVKVLPNTMEQLVSKDGTFSNNELIYSDKYKFAVESLPADPERGLPDRDVLVVYDIPYEDTTGMSDGEWKKHISINYYDYSYVDELWLPGGPDRLIYSGCRYRFVTSKNKSFKLENELEIVFVVNGERPKPDYDNTEEQINAMWGFDILKYVNFNQDAADTDTKENTDSENTEKEASAIKTTAALKGDADVNNEVGLSDVITVAKYNLNNELYPLENETAFANADMNSDGEVNGVDTSALIENQLGKK